MTLAAPTTTVTVKRRQHSDAADAFDADTGPAVTVAAAVPAHFSGVAVDESAAGSSQTYKATLLTDPCDLRHVDTVINETTGEVWEVRSARAVADVERTEPDSDAHVVAAVARITGIA